MESVRKDTVVFIRDNYNVPSSLFRFIQYQEYINSESIKLMSYSPVSLLSIYSRLPQKAMFQKKIMQVILYIVGIHRVLFFILYDSLIIKSKNVIIIRRFFPRKMPFWGLRLLQRYLRDKSVYWDFDDNIIEDEEIVPKEVKLLEARAKIISVTGDFLKRTLSPLAQKKVVFLPTTDVSFNDLIINEVIKSRLKSFDKELHMCWVGTKSNLLFLEDIIEELEYTAEKAWLKHNVKLGLNVVSNNKPKMKTKYLGLNYYIWSKELANKIILKSHLGLMPLRDTPFTRGKGGFKAIQYIGAGIPGIVSDVGFNSKVICNEHNGFLINENMNWETAILKYISNKELWIQHSYNAREFWSKNYNPQKTIDYFNSIING